MAPINMSMRRWSGATSLLLDDLHNPVSPRFDQNRTAVHDCIAIIVGAIFRRHVVIGNARIRQNRANPDRLVVLIGGAALLDHVTVKARTLIDSQNSGYAAYDAANDTAHHGADRAGRSFAIA
jgi:hypothetical protein